MSIKNGNVYVYEYKWCVLIIIMFCKRKQELYIKIN